MVGVAVGVAVGVVVVVAVGVVVVVVVAVGVGVVVAVVVAVGCIMKKDTIKQIREALAAATPGPWEVRDCDKLYSTSTMNDILQAERAEYHDDDTGCFCFDGDARLVKFLRNHAEELLDECEEWQDVKPTFDWRTKKLGEALEELNRYKRALEVAMERMRDQTCDGCEYGDDCPSDARHYVCRVCQILEALAHCDRILEGGDE